MLSDGKELNRPVTIIQDHEHAKAETVHISGNGILAGTPRLRRLSDIPACQEQKLISCQSKSKAWRLIVFRFNLPFQF